MRDIGYENQRTAELFMSLVKLLSNGARTKNIRINEKKSRAVKQSIMES